MNPRKKLVKRPTRTYLSLMTWELLLEDSPNSSGLEITLLTRLDSILFMLSSSPIPLFHCQLQFSHIVLSNCLLISFNGKTLKSSNLIRFNC